jgi:drug/metabolite transporter (DMT)-like permease
MNWQEEPSALIRGIGKMNKNTLADMVLLFVVLVWGATFVMVRNAISFLDPFTFNSIRFFAAFIILLISYLALYRKRPAVWTKSLFFSGSKIGIWLFLGYAFQTYGLLYTTPSKAGFLTGLSVIMVPVFSLLLLKQRLSRKTVIGAVSAAAGLYFMTASGQSSFNAGDFLVFLCAVSFAMQIIATAKFARLHPALPLTIIQVLTTAFLSALSSLVFRGSSHALNPSIFLKTEVWTALMVCAILATAFAFFAQTYFQAYTSPTRVALIFAMEPVFAAATSLIVTGEKLTVISLLGCILILLGMVVAELPAKTPASKAV